MSTVATVYYAGTYKGAPVSGPVRSLSGRSFSRPTRSPGSSMSSSPAGLSTRKVAASIGRPAPPTSWRGVRRRRPIDPALYDSTTNPFFE